VGKPPEPSTGAARRFRLESVSGRRFTGIVFRFIGSRFLRTPLSAAGSLRYGGRFNPPGGFEVLYAALTADTALAEREGILLIGPGIKAATTIRTGVLLRMTCKLNNVLDLCDDKQRTELGITLADILAPWITWNIPARHGETAVSAIAPSQQIGVTAREDGRFEAILAPSAKDPSGQCLAIFPDRLHNESRVSVDDPEGVVRATLGLP
jgi:RES domain-containing protein